MSFTGRRWNILENEVFEVGDKLKMIRKDSEECFKGWPLGCIVTVSEVKDETEDLDDWNSDWSPFYTYKFKECAYQHRYHNVEQYFMRVLLDEEEK